MDVAFGQCGCILKSLKAFIDLGNGLGSIQQGENHQWGDEQCLNFSLDQQVEYDRNEQTCKRHGAVGECQGDENKYGGIAAEPKAVLFEAQGQICFPEKNFPFTFLFYGFIIHMFFKKMKKNKSSNFIKYKHWLIILLPIFVFIEFD